MTWTLTIKNIAGIRTANATIQPGVNAVRAANWQGKSSLLAAVRTVMGVGTPLSEGTKSGFVNLETEDTSTSIDLYRENNVVAQEGTPYLTDEYDRLLGELFAFLDERNPIRQAVRNDEPLEELLTRPLDLEKIDERIADHKREREQIEAELKRAEKAADKLPEVEERKNSFENDLQEHRKQLDNLPDVNVNASETKRDELSNVRAEQTQAERRLKRLERTLEHAREKQKNRQRELSELNIDPTIDDETDLEDDLAAARQELRNRERETELLQSVYESNKRILDEDHVNVISDVSHELLGDSATCWVCGQGTTRENLEEQLEKLGERVKTLQSDVSEHKNRVETLEDRHQEYRRAKRRQSEIKSEIQSLKETISEHEESISRTTKRLEELTDQIKTLEDQIEEINDERTDLEGHIRYLETEIEEIQDEIEEIEEKAAHRETHLEERNRLTNEITQLRTRREETKQRIRDKFGAEMNKVIPQFEVGFESARLTSDFELVIAREGREASLDALSEGEVELLGIIVTLAGYDAFEVGDAISVLTLDQVGSIAADNLGMLVEYLSGRTKYLILTAFPEDTSFDGHEIDPTSWTIISDDLMIEPPS